MIADEPWLDKSAADCKAARTQVGPWETHLSALASEAAAIKAAGQWRTGPRTLLAVLGMHELERKLVTCLAWILRPDGHHGLGNRVVKALFERFGLPFDPTAQVRVTREEPRFTSDGKRTPADLIVRAGGVCVLIEAKVNAKQHGDQCARLARLWADEEATLVYLTREGTGPDGLPCSAAWKPLTWRHIAGFMTPPPNDASAGARDFLETLQLLYGSKGPSMLDEKTKFYMRHWQLLSEWATLRDGATREITAAVHTAAGSLDATLLAEAEHGWDMDLASHPTFELWRPSWQRGEVHAAIALQWKPAELLTDADPWPYVGVRVKKPKHPERHAFVKTMTEQLETYASRLGWSGSQIETGWLWWRQVAPTDAEDDLDSLTVECRTALEAGWQHLRSPLDDLFTG
ncbi:PD-(D/E)XK nuclease family protein [Micromonospora echinofusca]|uniref:PD-(D/E)XK nuclease superfamily protein n=1 Tax=Micromonospora echinofusca TaxID=47858 RepID=A0ABS3VJT0_MICEH|nr:PD-(D/E)XK nuclease family protein [Micromonospora echinofusca]MBO4204785.1 hypothetical protein [Micromonospora echinofusca]